MIFFSVNIKEVFYASPWLTLGYHWKNGRRRFNPNICFFRSRGEGSKSHLAAPERPETDRRMTSWLGKHAAVVFPPWLRQGDCTENRGLLQGGIYSFRASVFSRHIASHGHTIFPKLHWSSLGTGVHMMYTITRGPSKLVTQRRTGEWNWPVVVWKIKPKAQCLNINWSISAHYRDIDLSVHRWAAFGWEEPDVKLACLNNIGT